MDSSPSPLEQILQLGQKRFDILKIAIDGSEAHVGDLVERFEALHDKFADVGGGDFAVGAFGKFAFDGIDDFREFSDADRTFLAGFQETFQDLLPVEFFAAAVAFDHHERNVIAALIGGEAPLAFEAFTAAANHIAFFAFAGIDDFVFAVTAKRTRHLKRFSSPTCFIVRQ